MCSGTGKIFAGIDRHALHEIFAVLREVAYCSATLTDTNGNMTSDGTNTYEWDAENRLIKINYPGIGNDSQFVYDGFGKTGEILGYSASSLTITRCFSWC